MLRVLERAHRLLNDALFAGTLGSEVVLTTPPRGKATRLGAYRADAWRRASGAPAEIAIFAEGLGRPLREVLVTLLEMMVHQANAEAGDQDNSRDGAYLNGVYAFTAQAAGLFVYPLGPKQGYGVDGLDPEHAWASAVVEVASSTLGPEFTLVRLPPPPVKVSRARTITCDCNPPRQARSSDQEIRWRCADCGAWVRAEDEGQGEGEPGAGEGQGRVVLAAKR